MAQSTVVQNARRQQTLKYRRQQDHNAPGPNQQAIHQNDR